jgi:GTP-binding protein
MLDLSGLSGRDPLEDFHTINRELAHYSKRLSDIPQIIALNKIDVAADQGLVERAQQILERDGHTVFRISAVTHQGLQPLLYNLWDRLEEARRSKPEGPVEEVVRIKAERKEDPRRWEARQTGQGEWVVEGAGLERLVAMTDLNNDYAVRRFQRTLERAGVHRKLKELGARDGDTVRIRDVEFDYADEDREDEEEPDEV